jgi:hypothetical protein
VSVFEQTDEELIKQQEAAQARAEQEMEAAGVATSTSVQADYFGFADTEKWFFPDNKTYVELQALNEGARREYQNKTNKEVAIKRLSGDAVMKMQNGDDRHVLLVNAIIGWNLLRDGQPVAFHKGSNGSILEQWLARADPKLIDGILKQVHKMNPWLLADLSIEEIDKQISDLEEMKTAKLKEDEGNAS